MRSAFVILAILCISAHISSKAAMAYIIGHVTHHVTRQTGRSIWLTASKDLRSQCDPYCVAYDVEGRPSSHVL
jgi:hypothetical protein